MATVTLTCSSSANDTFKSKARLKVTYTASNGTFKITELEGCRTDGYRTYSLDFTSVTVKVGTVTKSVKISNGIDFGASSNYKKWGATDTSWTGITVTSIPITITMPNSSTAMDDAVFKGTGTVSWSKYDVTYDANGGSGAPSAQTKTYGTALTLSKTTPTRTGYTFSKWNTKSDGSGTSYSAGGSYKTNSDVKLYAIWSENVLTVNFYSNYATSYNGTYTPSNTVNNNNVLVYSQKYYYDNSYTSGLLNYNSGSSIGMIRTGYTLTGKWGTSMSGGTLVDQDDTSYNTGQALAKALGKDLSSGSASVNVYAQWSENKLTVNLYSNYADYGTYEGTTLNVSANSNVLVRSKDYLYDTTYSDGLNNVQNSESLYLSRTGYTPTGKWGTSTSGGTLLDQATSYTGQNLAKAVGKDLSNGNASINLYAQWSENKLTVNYYSNYATTAFDGALNTVGSDKNVLVYTYDFYYDDDYSEYGLANYSGSSGSTYMTRTGYTATGNWGTSTNGGMLVNENSPFSTGQAIATAFGKNISNGDTSVNVYAQWRPNTLNIRYHVNGGTVNSGTYYVNNGLIYNTSSSSVLEDKWDYDIAHENGLYNATTFGLTREGYEFVGWAINVSDTTIFDQDDTSVVPTELASNIITGDQTITLYAVWEISGVVYIDNGTTFEPYLVYIDNGSSWDLYLAYIDDGTNWKIIS